MPETPEFSVDLDALDAPESELTNAPEPAAAEPAAAAPETPEPKATPTPERVRDPATGQFTPQAPASMPDPVKAVEPEHAKVVPLPVLLEERRAARREIEEAQRKTMELEQRLKALESPPAPEPSFTDDPKAYIDAKVNQVQEMVKPIEQKAEVGAQQVQLQQFMRHVGSIEAEFVKENPDYYQALDHVRSIRRAELAEFYPQATPEQIVQQIDREELEKAAILLQQGRNPSEAVYRVAKAYGFQKPAAPAAAAPARPNVPQAPVGDPGATLGSGGGALDDGQEIVDGDDDAEMLQSAIAERFGRRR
jgi:hypothetical protein